MELKNYESHYEPEKTLNREEVDAIVAVVQSTIAWLSLDRPGLSEAVKKGSFALVGRKDGAYEKAKPIVCFDFENGPKANYYNYEKGQYRSSRWMIEYDAQMMNKIDAATGIIREVNYRDLGWQRRILALQTTAGCFFCSVICPNAYETEIYLAVAKSIALMGKEDTVLQGSYGNLLCGHPGHYRGDEIYALDQYVQNLFSKCELPELKAWREWHEPANNAGELSLFFE